MEFEFAHAKSDAVRVPALRRGTALVVERYRAENVKAVVLHPDDFSELEDASQLLEDASAPAAELSDLGARAHEIVESPEAPLIEDQAAARRLLGV
jgi:hypothetical protein